MQFEKLVAPECESEISKHWKYTERVYLSILCITYNHEKYITDAIESFLAQETDYRFEIIIHDDASADNTREVIEYYSSKYPNIIKPIFNTTNQYSQDVNLPIKNCNKVASGDYIAFCEGDDYWICENKLQNQISYMQENKSVDLIFNNFHEFVQKNKMFRINCINKNNASNLTFDSFLVNFGYYAPMTWVVRSKLWFEVTDYSEQHLDSTFVWLVNVLNKGIVKFVDETTAVYRILEESASKSSSVIKILKRNESLLNTQYHLCKEYRLDECLKSKFEKVNFLLNVRTLYDKDISFSKRMSLISKFKFSYLSSMQPKEFAKLLLFVFPPLRLFIPRFKRRSKK